MKVHHVAVMAMLLGTGWSTNVVYEFKTGQSLWRGVASEEVVITIDNVASEVEKLEENSKKFSDKAKEILEVSDKEDVSLAKLVELKNNDLKEIKELYSSLNTFKIEQFLNEAGEDDAVKALSERVIAAKELANVEENMPKFSAIEERIKKMVEEQTVAQQKTLDDLSTNICEQNRTLSSLTSKIEELLKDKKKVVDAADDDGDKDEDDDKDEEKDDEAQARFERQLALMKAFSSNFVMPPSTFFNTASPIGLQSATNPLGVDVNFMMMANMLTGSNGFGPRANINYAPVYNQQKSYIGMPSMTNFGRDAVLGNTLFEGQSMNTQGIDPVYLRAIQGNLTSDTETGPIFSRGNGLQGAFQF